MNSEQQQLVKKAENNIRSAKLLLSEEIYDVAVSRSYYAIFYIAEAFLLVENLSFSKHSGVIGKFGEIFAKAGRVPKEFHRYLIMAEEARTKADYDAASISFPTEAQLQIERAEAFLALAQSQL